MGKTFLRNRFTDTDTEDTEIDKILERGYTCPHYKYKKYNSIRIKLIVFKIQYNLRNTGESFFWQKLNFFKNYFQNLAVSSSTWYDINLQKNDIRVFVIKFMVWSTKHAERHMFKIKF